MLVLVDNDTLTINEVFEARDLLVEQHIAFPKSPELLQAEWAGAITRAGLAGVDVWTMPQPEFKGAIDTISADKEFAASLSL